MARSNQSRDCRGFWQFKQVIKNHLRSIFDKLGLWSRFELALFVAAHGGADWGRPVLEEQLPVAGSEIGIARRSH